MSSEVAILAVGTEILEGQITNRNATWLSTELNELGYSVRWHLSVADVPEDMKVALSFLKSQNIGHVFVTGGLGPTSDDRTRQVVSEWSQQPLYFDDLSYRRIITLMTERGRAVNEGQKHQCFFPVGAQVIVNEAGTANAFLLQTESQRIWALPGPPTEIQAVWESFVSEELKKNAPGLRFRKLRKSWHCLGIGESDLAEKCEAIVAGQDVEIGYRVHFPYVEVKLWLDARFSRDSSKIEFIERIEAVVQPWLIYRDNEDILDQLLEVLPEGDIVIQDFLTQSEIVGRWTSYLRQRNLNRQWQLITGVFGNSLSDNQNINSDKTYLVCHWPGREKSEIAVGVCVRGLWSWKKKSIDLRWARSPSRFRRLLAEVVFCQWVQMLNEPCGLTGDHFQPL